MAAAREAVVRALAAVGGAVLGAAALCGCVPSRPLEGAPAWFPEEIERSRTADYPPLATLPQPSAPSRPASAWDALDRALRRDAERLLASPRAAPVPAEGPREGEEFERRTREALRPITPPPPSE
jgi:hypothetical protein